MGEVSWSRESQLKLWGSDALEATTGDVPPRSSALLDFLQQQSSEEQKEAPFTRMDSAMQQTASDGGGNRDKDDTQSDLASVQPPSAERAAPAQTAGQLTTVSAQAAHVSAHASQQYAPPSDASLGADDRKTQSGSDNTAFEGGGGCAVPAGSTLHSEVQERSGRPPIVNWISPSASAPSPFASAAALPFKELEASSKEAPPVTAPRVTPVPVGAPQTPAALPSAAEAVTGFGSRHQPAVDAAGTPASQARPGSWRCPVEWAGELQTSSAGGGTEATQGQASSEAHAEAAPVSQEAAKLEDQHSEQQKQQQQQQQSVRGQGLLQTRGFGPRRSFATSSSNSKMGHANSDSVSSWRCPPDALGSLEPSPTVSPRASPQQSPAPSQPVSPRSANSSQPGSPGTRAFEAAVPRPTGPFARVCSVEPSPAGPSSLRSQTRPRDGPHSPDSVTSQMSYDARGTVAEKSACGRRFRRASASLAVQIRPARPFPFNEPANPFGAPAPVQLSPEARAMLAATSLAGVEERQLQRRNPFAAVSQSVPNNLSEMAALRSEPPNPFSLAAPAVTNPFTSTTDGWPRPGGIPPPANPFAQVTHQAWAAPPPEFSGFSTETSAASNPPSLADSSPVFAPLPVAFSAVSTARAGLTAALKPPVNPFSVAGAEGEAWPAPPPLVEGERQPTLELPAVAAMPGALWNTDKDTLLPHALIMQGLVTGRSEAGRPSQRTVQQRAQQRARTEASRSSSGGMDSGSDSGADVGVTHDASWQTRTAATSAPLPVRTSLSTHHLMCGACSPMDDPVIDLAQGMRRGNTAPSPVTGAQMVVAPPGPGARPRPPPRSAFAVVAEPLPSVRRASAPTESIAAPAGLTMPISPFEERRVSLEVSAPRTSSEAEAAGATLLAVVASLESEPSSSRSCESGSGRSLASLILDNSFADWVDNPSRSSRASSRHSTGSPNGSLMPFHRLSAGSRQSSVDLLRAAALVRRPLAKEGRVTSLDRPQRLRAHEPGQQEGPPPRPATHASSAASPHHSMLTQSSDGPFVRAEPHLILSSTQQRARLLALAAFRHGRIAVSAARRPPVALAASSGSSTSSAGSASNGSGSGGGSRGGRSSTEAVVNPFMGPPSVRITIAAEGRQASGPPSCGRPPISPHRSVRSSSLQGAAALQALTPLPPLDAVPEVSQPDQALHISVAATSDTVTVSGTDDQAPAAPDTPDLSSSVVTAESPAVLSHKASQIDRLGSPRPLERSSTEVNLATSQPGLSTTGSAPSALTPSPVRLTRSEPSAAYAMASLREALLTGGDVRLAMPTPATAPATHHSAATQASAGGQVRPQQYQPHGPLLPPLPPTGTVRRFRPRSEPSLAAKMHGNPPIPEEPAREAAVMAESLQAPSAVALTAGFPSRAGTATLPPWTPKASAGAAPGIELRSGSKSQEGIPPGAAMLRPASRSQELNPFAAAAPVRGAPSPLRHLLASSSSEGLVSIASTGGACGSGQFFSRFSGGQLSSRQSSLAVNVAAASAAMSKMVAPGAMSPTSVFERWGSLASTVTAGTTASSRRGSSASQASLASHYRATVIAASISAAIDAQMSRGGSSITRRASGTSTGGGSRLDSPQASLGSGMDSGSGTMSGTMSGMSGMLGAPLPSWLPSGQPDSPAGQPTTSPTASSTEAPSPHHVNTPLPQHGSPHGTPVRTPSRIGSHEMAAVAEAARTAAAAEQREASNMARLTRDMAGATPPQLLRTPLRTTSLPAPSLTQRHPWWNVGSAPATSPYASPFATDQPEAGSWWLKFNEPIQESRFAIWHASQSMHGQADVQQLVVAMLVAVVGLVDSWAGTALPRRWLVACLAVASLLALALRYPVWFHDYREGAIKAATLTVVAHTALCARQEAAAGAPNAVAWLHYATFQAAVPAIVCLSSMMRFTVWMPAVVLNLAAALLPLVPLQHTSAVAWVPLACSGAAMTAIVAVPLALSYRREASLRAHFLASSRLSSH